MKRSPLKRRSERADLISEADVLVRQIIMERDHNECQRCGNLHQLQAAHLLSKARRPRLRFELLNVIALCKGCHLYFAHKDPIGFTDWLQHKYPGRIEALKLMAATAGRTDLKELLIGLRYILRAKDERQKRERSGEASSKGDDPLRSHQP